MSKNIKKALCLTLAVAMTGSMFTACGKKEEKKKEVATLTPMTTEEISLSYQFWEDGPIVNTLIENWNQTYPNIEIKPNEVLVGDNNTTLSNLLGSADFPDVFWVLGTPDFAITTGMLTNMDAMWQADQDARNVIGGIDKFKLGYLGTEGKWTTPVKFFPTEAWLNMNYFETHNTKMPDTNWTFEEMSDLVVSLTTGDGQGWGMSEAVSVITWYPIASDPNCIGEFGWDGKEFDLTNWADGMSIEKEWRDNGYIAPGLVEGTDLIPQDNGYVAMRWDNWWCWERFWDKDEMYTKKVYWVPYILPHTEDNQSSNTYLATTDFGGISSQTPHKREAYEVLKFFCWGKDGWKYKLSRYDEIVSVGADASVSGLIPGPINNCPITTDEETWKNYEAKHPTSAAGGDKVGKEKYGIDRAPYFDAFFDVVKSANWTCYGSAQIPGFDTWLLNDYRSKVAFGEYDNGVEDAVFIGGENPEDFVQDLTEKANKTNKEMIENIAAYLS